MIVVLYLVIIIGNIIASKIMYEKLEKNPQYFIMNENVQR